MQCKVLIAGSVVLSVLVLFSGTGYRAGAGEVGIDQWNKINASPAANSDASFRSAMDRAAAFQEKQQYREAIAAYSEALQLKPGDSEAYRKRGAVKFRTRDTGGAMSDCQKAIELDPRNAKAYNLKGAILREQKDLQGALAAYETAVKLDPAFAGAVINAANIKIDRGDLQGAATDLNRLLAAEPSNLDALIARGSVLTLLKDDQGARSDLKRALAIDPKNAFAAKVLKSLGPEDMNAQGQAQQRPQAAPAVAPPPPIVAPVTAKTARQEEAVLQPAPAGVAASELFNADVLAGGRPGGDVLATKALMRLVVGPLDAEQEKQFNAQYAVAYSAPTATVAAHHRKLNQSLIDAIVERELMLRSLREYLSLIHI